MDRALAPPTHPRVSSGIPCFFRHGLDQQVSAPRYPKGHRRFQTGFSQKHASMSRRNESMIKARSNPKSGEPPFFFFPASLFILLFIKERCHGTTTLLFCGGAHFFAQFLQAFASTTYLAQNPIGIGFSSLQPINFPFFLPIFFYNWTDQQSPKDQQGVLRSRLLPGYYFPTSFSSRGLQGPHHHHLYHHHHVRRDGPSDQPTRYHHQRKPTRRTTNSTFSRTEDERSITTIHKNTTRILVGTESVRRFPSSRRS